MKVAIIYGQLHHGNTYKITQLIKDKLNCDDDDVKEFFVNGMPQCVGCYQCIMKDELRCPHRNKTQSIIEAMDESDVMIFASPNYCFEMTGQLKSFCDHLGYRWMIHRPANYKHKIGVAISTAAGGGAKSVTKSLKRQMQWWSVGKVYRFESIIWANSVDELSDKKRAKIRKKAERLAEKINRKVGHVKPSIKVWALFKMMIPIHSGEGANPVERVYWESLDKK